MDKIINSSDVHSLLAPLYHRQQQPPEQQPWEVLQGSVSHMEEITIHVQLTWAVQACAEPCCTADDLALRTVPHPLPHNYCSQRGKPKSPWQHLFLTSHDAKRTFLTLSWSEAACFPTNVLFFPTVNMTNRVALLLRKSYKNSEDDCWWTSPWEVWAVCHGMARGLSLGVPSIRGGKRYGNLLSLLWDINDISWYCFCLSF